MGDTTRAPPLSGMEEPSAGIGRADPIYATIYTILRDHLTRGALTPGLVLGQASIARAFNVSRIPAGMALGRLNEEGLVHTFEGRGYVVPGGEPLRADLFEAGLALSPEITAPSANRREQIYPEVEHAVAVCLAHGRFLLNETALAQHYDVSRTIAHEVLTQLERSGIIQQDSNNRWYAGPLSADEFRHHYEMRWLLEPQALRQAFPHLDRADLEARLDRLNSVARAEIEPLSLERLEGDLHFDTLAPCGNPILLNTVRRSQRVLIATHSTFVDFKTSEDIRLMADEHMRVYRSLLGNDLESAAKTLEAHLKRSLGPNLKMLEKLRPLPEKLRPDYLSQVK